MAQPADGPPIWESARPTESYGGRTVRQFWKTALQNFGWDRARFWAVLFALAAVCSGCGDRKDNVSDPVPHLHVATPPHGGTPAALGDDYQIEWVLDVSNGVVQAYILDGEMENFVRITQPSFDVAATVSGRSEVLHLVAVANSATGEKVGSTSLFEGRAGWLKTTNTIDVSIREINVAGTTYSNITFAIPKGNVMDKGK